MVGFAPEGSQAGVPETLSPAVEADASTVDLAQEEFSVTAIDQELSLVGGAGTALAFVETPELTAAKQALERIYSQSASVAAQNVVTQQASQATAAPLTTAGGSPMPAAGFFAAAGIGVVGIVQITADGIQRAEQNQALLEQSRSPEAARERFAAWQERRISGAPEIQQGADWLVDIHGQAVELAARGEAFSLSQEHIANIEWLAERITYFIEGGYDVRLLPPALQPENFNAVQESLADLQQLSFQRQVQTHQQNYNQLQAEVDQLMTEQLALFRENPTSEEYRLEVVNYISEQLASLGTQADRVEALTGQNPLSREAERRVLESFNNATLQIQQVAAGQLQVQFEAVLAGAHTGALPSDWAEVTASFSEVVGEDLSPLVGSILNRQEHLNYLATLADDPERVLEANDLSQIIADLQTIRESSAVLAASYGENYDYFSASMLHQTVSSLEVIHLPNNLPDTPVAPIEELPSTTRREHPPSAPPLPSAPESPTYPPDVETEIDLAPPPSERSSPEAPQLSPEEPEIDFSQPPVDGDTNPDADERVTTSAEATPPFVDPAPLADPLSTVPEEFVEEFINAEGEEERREILEKIADRLHINLSQAEEKMATSLVAEALSAAQDVQIPTEVLEPLGPYFEGFESANYQGYVMERLAEVAAEEAAQAALREALYRDLEDRVESVPANEVKREIASLIRDWRASNYGNDLSDLARDMALRATGLLCQKFANSEASFTEQQARAFLDQSAGAGEQVVERTRTPQRSVNQPGMTAELLASLDEQARNDKGLVQNERTINFLRAHYPEALNRLDETSAGLQNELTLRAGTFYYYFDLAGSGNLESAAEVNLLGSAFNFYYQRISQSDSSIYGGDGAVGFSNDEAAVRAAGHLARRFVEQRTGSDMTSLRMVVIPVEALGDALEAGVWKNHFGEIVLDVSGPSEIETAFKRLPEGTNPYATYGSSAEYLDGLLDGTIEPNSEVEQQVLTYLTEHEELLTSIPTLRIERSVSQQPFQVGTFILNHRLTRQQTLQFYRNLEEQFNCQVINTMNENGWIRVQVIFPDGISEDSFSTELLPWVQAFSYQHGVPWSPGSDLRNTTSLTHIVDGDGNIHQTLAGREFGPFAAAAKAKLQVQLFSDYFSEAIENYLQEASGQYSWNPTPGKSPSDELASLEELHQAAQADTEATTREVRQGIRALRAIYAIQVRYDERALTMSPSMKEAFNFARSYELTRSGIDPRLFGLERVPEGVEVPGFSGFLLPR